MARNDTVDVGQYAWTQITNANITGATFQITGANGVRIMGTVGEVAPTDPEDGIIYEPRQGEAASRTLADIFPGVSANRIYARSIAGASRVFISHA